MRENTAKIIKKGSSEESSDSSDSDDVTRSIGEVE
jgi:hypothetical protein